jgi:hypothetical protein
MSSPKEEEKVREELLEQQPEGEDGNDEVGNSQGNLQIVPVKSGR